MKQIFLILVIMYFALNISAKTSTVAIYRTNESRFNKLKVRSFFGLIKADTIPSGNCVYFTTSDISFVVLKSRIENYAGWPDVALKLNMVENDTTYVKMSFKRDAFGNPSIQLKVVPGNIAKADLESISAKRSISDVENITNRNGKKLPKYSGTGFLISSQGFLVTNYHVIEKGTQFKVRNVNGNKEFAYDVTTIVKDEKNDLAILKLNDKNIKLDTIPYAIKNSVADLGEKIELFGYPLTTSMGDDVKLTNGIISSVNGFNGDTNSYQLSAPIQPGNSGGPVFDEKGNLVAIVNAKHLLAENATYAIKSNHLLVLLQSLSDFQIEKSSVELWRMSLVEQTKILQKLVYIVEVD